MFCSPLFIFQFCSTVYRTMLSLISTTIIAAPVSQRCLSPACASSENATLSAIVADEYGRVKMLARHESGQDVSTATPTDTNYLCLLYIYIVTESSLSRSQPLAASLFQSCGKHCACHIALQNWWLQLIIVCSRNVTWETSLRMKAYKSMQETAKRTNGVQIYCRFESRN